VITQIYGITTVEDAAAVAEIGPDHVGVVLDEGFGTWDSVDLATAQAIVAALASVRVVTLSLATDRDAILRTVEQVGGDIAHVVRVTETWTPEQVARLRDDLNPVELMLTVGVRGPEALGTAQQFAACADYLLLDSAHPSTGVVGATGHTHDWDLSRSIVEAVTAPVILAGGLGPENVADAMRIVRPAGVDSETRTSRTDDRRRKDLDKVRRFVDLARSV
jgi:phosphoribosylanthranilate isomerase